MIHAQQEPDGTLVVSHDSSGWSKFLGGVGALFLLTLMYDLFIGARGDDRAVGLIGASLTCAAMALAFLEVARFSFDPRGRTIDWRRRWAWSVNAGSIPFATVRDVLVQSPIGDEGIPSRRLCLKLADDREVPVTRAYLPDHDDVMLKLAGRLNALIGGKDGGSDEAVAALVRAGQKIDAVKLLRQSRGLSLDEAKRQVDEMSR